MNSNSMDISSGPPQPIKIPMNLPLYSEGARERFPIKGEDIIKNDEGTDRIRMARQAGNVPSNSLYALPTFTNPIPDELLDHHQNVSFPKSHTVNITGVESHPERNALRTTNIFGPVPK